MLHFAHEALRVEGPLGIAPLRPLPNLFLRSERRVQLAELLDECIRVSAIAGYGQQADGAGTRPGVEDGVAAAVQMQVVVAVLSVLVLVADRKEVAEVECDAVGIRVPVGSLPVLTHCRITGGAIARVWRTLQRLPPMEVMYVPSAATSFSSAAI